MSSEDRNLATASDSQDVFAILLFFSDNATASDIFLTTWVAHDKPDDASCDDMSRHVTTSLKTPPLLSGLV